MQIKRIGKENIAMLVLRNCRLVTLLTEGTELETADLALDGGRIRQIAPCGTAFEGKYEELDLGGKFVMPGMIDMHTHLRSRGGIKGEDVRSDPLKPCSVTLDEYMFAQWYLDNGYTTVRDVGDNIANPAIALRNHINAGFLEGPRLFCSGPTLTPTEIGFDAAWSAPNHYDVNSPLEMRERVRFCLQQGSDFIKLYGSGSMMVEEGQPGALIMEPDEMLEAVTQAKRKNTYCAIHAHGAEACEVAARTGVRTIEHASFIEPETLEYLQTRTAEGHGIVLTVSIFDDVLAAGTQKVSIRNTVYEHLRRIRDYDILVGWGTDTSMGFYKKRPFAEFEIRRDALGFTNEELLRQVTINSAKLMMKGHLIGTIKEGKCADLIVLEADPVKHLEVLGSRPLHVFRDGRLVR